MLSWSKHLYLAIKCVFGIQKTQTVMLSAKNLLMPGAYCREFTSRLSP